jgi:hypothetical protein
MIIRFSTSGNPLGLELGERCVIKKECRVEYVEDDKKLLFTALPKGSTAKVVGVKKKATGRYVKGSLQGLGDDYDPPYLKVDKYHILYEFKRLVTDEPFFVHSDDIEVPDAPSL